MNPVTVIVGVGPGNGAAFARRFSAAGHTVALLARRPDLTELLARELPSARAYACDVGDEASIVSTFRAIEADLGTVTNVVYNAGSGTWGNVESITPKDFEQAWRVNTLGALVTSQQVIPAMKRAGAGSIVFIGATASRRGGIQTAAFAPAKAAQRSLAESMARHLGPSGIHVSVVIVDGVVDLASTRARMPDKPDDFFIKPSELAETVFFLTQQPRSAWSFEVDTRPFRETW